MTSKEHYHIYSVTFVNTAIGRLSENLYIMGNEPSQALYCIQVGET